MRHEVVLEGCRRDPLADYLKGLGVFRLVAEQADPDARGRWSSGAFVLSSRLDREALLAFFAEGYAPTPIVAPWNGGSGFYAKDTQDGIATIEASQAARFAPYRAAIAACREVVHAAGLRERPEREAKHQLVEQLRASLPDDALRWIDAAVALEDGGPKYPPLLGTGGNDGRLDFSNNQMQRLAETLLASDGERAQLRAALFGEPAARLSRVAIGQLRPAAAGGANAGEGFDRDSLVNPWDFILALEGALMFAGAVSRRLEAAAPGAMTFPFTVRASGAGYGSASRSDEAEARDEMWLPLWSRPASLGELRALFGEGRARIGARVARTGVDFARAIASLGVDRGIDEFARVGFLVRNGLSYFATPLGDWTVAQTSRGGLLDELDDWLAQLTRAAGGKHAPAALRRAASHVDDAVLEVCRRGDARDHAALLVALGEVEAVGARSTKVRDALRPVPRLSPAWFAAVDDGTAEVRLAAALAASGLRRYLVPAIPRGPAWVWDAAQQDAVFAERALVDNLIAVVQRRAALDQPVTLDGPIAGGTAELAAFLAGELDDDRIQGLARGMAAIAWTGGEPAATPPRDLPLVFSLCRLALTPRPLPGLRLPSTPGIADRLAMGDPVRATELAVRRLRGAGLIPRCGPITTSRELARRAAAALLFPLDPPAIREIRRQLIRTTSLEQAHHDADGP